MYGKSVLFSRVVSFSVELRRTKKDSTKKLLEFLSEMPKAHGSRIAEAQRQRQLISKKGEKYGPSSVYLQVLGSGANGAPSTLYMFTDQKRYLFNCGECTQRLAHEHKVKLSRLDHIFITSKTWRHIGGLPGLSLTLQDVGVPNIVLHGPDGLDELYNATKRFVIMKDMNVMMAKCSPIHDFEDSVMTVRYVLLGPYDDLMMKTLLKEPKEREAKRAKVEHIDKEYEEFIKDDTDYYMHNQSAQHKAAKAPKSPPVKAKLSPDRHSLTEKERENLNTEQVFHQLQKKFTCSVAFICTLKKRLGTLNLERCVELGVKPGPLLGQLKSGRDVLLPNGKLVRSADVKTPDDPGPVFIVLDVPDVSYLKEADFAAHFANGVNPPEQIPALVVHFTPPHVFHDLQYRAFMSKFGPTTRHLILNAQNSCLGSEAVHRTQHRLHLLDPDIFPLLKDVSVPAVWNSTPPQTKDHSPDRMKGLDELRNRIAVAQFQSIMNMEGSHKGEGLEGAETEDRLEVTAGRTLTMFQLRPKKLLDRSQEPKLHIQDYIQETMDVPGFAQSLQQFQQVVEGVRYRQGKGQEYPKVVFLGTGSCIPSKTRNTSAIVLRVDENKSMLLDCGEGTFGQLVRFYGPKKVNGFLKTLKAIYISHLHADHHIGLIGVLQARRLALQELNSSAEPDPLVLMAPGQILSWLTLYDQQFEKIRRDVTLVPNQNLVLGSETSTHDLTAAMLAQIGVDSVVTCPVAHCPNAFGVAVQAQGHKITYSGDTIPCDELVQLGENSHLLIHEATMEDELTEEARIKMHSTASQAIEIGKRMGARYTVLTHFSQRYARLPRLNANILDDNHSVGIAFDNMQITMNDLELLPHMYAPLQLMFAEHCVEMELKAQHRARQKELSARRPRSPKTASTYGSRARGRGRNSSSITSGSNCFYRDSYASRLRQELTKAIRSAWCPTQLDSKAFNTFRASSQGTPLVCNFRGPTSPRPSSPERERQDNLSKSGCRQEAAKSTRSSHPSRSRTESPTARQSKSSSISVTPTRPISPTRTNAGLKGDSGERCLDVAVTSPLTPNLGSAEVTDTLTPQLRKQPSIGSSGIGQRVGFILTEIPPEASIVSSMLTSQSKQQQHIEDQIEHIIMGVQSLSIAKKPSTSRDLSSEREDNSTHSATETVNVTSPGSNKMEADKRESLQPDPVHVIDSHSRTLTSVSQSSAVAPPPVSEHKATAALRKMQGLVGKTAPSDQRSAAYQNIGPGKASMYSGSGIRSQISMNRSPMNSSINKRVLFRNDHSRQSSPTAMSRTSQQLASERINQNIFPKQRVMPSVYRQERRPGLWQDTVDRATVPLCVQRNTSLRPMIPPAAEVIEDSFSGSVQPTMPAGNHGSAYDKGLNDSSSYSVPSPLKINLPTARQTQAKLTQMVAEKKPSWIFSTNMSSRSRRGSPPDPNLRYGTTKPAPAPLGQTMATFRDRLKEIIRQGQHLENYKSETRPTSCYVAAHSVLNFTPQLEEIKSSFYLLDKTRNNIEEQSETGKRTKLPQAKKKIQNKEFSLNSKKLAKLEVLKPKPVDENERRTKLMQAKKKFHQKKYRINSKYDQIEGLNWISWK